MIIFFIVTRKQIPEYVRNGYERMFHVCQIVHNSFTTYKFKVSSALTKGEFFDRLKVLHKGGSYFVKQVVHEPFGKRVAGDKEETWQNSWRGDSKTKACAGAESFP